MLASPITSNLPLIVVLTDVLIKSPPTVASAIVILLASMLASPITSNLPLIVVLTDVLIKSPPTVASAIVILLASMLASPITSNLPLIVVLTDVLVKLPPTDASAIVMSSTVVIVVSVTVLNFVMSALLADIVKLSDAISAITTSFSASIFALPVTSNLPLTVVLRDVLVKLPPTVAVAILVSPLVVIVVSASVLNVEMYALLADIVKLSDATSAILTSLASAFKSPPTVASAIVILLASMLASPITSNLPLIVVLTDVLIKSPPTVASAILVSPTVVIFVSISVLNFETSTLSANIIRLSDVTSVILTSFARIYVVSLVWP